MKKILLPFLFILLLGFTGCSKKNVPGLAYRDFSFTRSHGDDLPLMTETDIPNSYICTETKFKIADEEGRDMAFYGFGLKNGESTKKFVIDQDAPAGFTHILKSGTIKDIFEINVSYFCANNQLVLNNILKKSYTSFGIEDITQY